MCGSTLGVIKVLTLFLIRQQQLQECGNQAFSLQPPIPYLSDKADQRKMKTLIPVIVALFMSVHLLQLSSLASAAGKAAAAPASAPDPDSEVALVQPAGDKVDGRMGEKKKKGGGGGVRVIRMGGGGGGGKKKGGKKGKKKG